MIRQSLERAVFVHDEKTIHLTTTAAVTEVALDDTEETLYKRLEQTLKQAKQAGANRSFVHDGREAELIEAPDLKTEKNQFQV